MACVLHRPTKTARPCGSGFSATGKLKRTDFNIGSKYPGSAVVYEDVKFSIDVEIDKQ